MRDTKIKTIIMLGMVLLVCGVGFVVFIIGKITDTDQVQAVRLLSQAKERIAWNSFCKYTGIYQMLDRYTEKGGTVDVKVSGVQIDTGGVLDAGLGTVTDDSSVFYSFISKLAETDASEWEDYALEMSAQYDRAAERTSHTLVLSRGDDAVSVTRCRDEDEGEEWIAFPELLENKVFHITDEEEQEEADGDNASEGAAGIPDAEIPGKEADMQGKNALLLYDDLQEVLREHIPQILSDVSVRDLGNTPDGEQGYNIKISQNLFNSLSDEILELAKDRKAGMFQKLISYFNYFHIPSDLDIHIYGRDENLSRLDFSVVSDTGTYNVELKFNGSEGASVVGIEVKGSFNKKPVYFKAEIIDKSGESYVSEGDVSLEYDGAELFGVKGKFSVVPGDDRCATCVSIRINGSEAVEVSARGNIKDLKQGICASLIFDSFSLRFFGKECARGALDIRLASQEGNLQVPQGEIIEFSPDTGKLELLAYGARFVKNLAAASVRMKIIDLDWIRRVPAVGDFMKAVSG